MVEIKLSFPTLNEAVLALSKLSPAPADAVAQPARGPGRPPKSEAVQSAPAAGPSVAPVDKPSTATTPATVSEPDLSEAVARAITERIATPDGKAKTAAVLAQFKQGDGSACKAGKHLQAGDRAAFIAKLNDAFAEGEDSMT